MRDLFEKLIITRVVNPETGQMRWQLSDYGGAKMVVHSDLAKIMDAVHRAGEAGAVINISSGVYVIHPLAPPLAEATRKRVASWSEPR